MSVRNETLKIGYVESVDGAAIVVEASQLKVRLSGDIDTHVTVGSFVNCGGDHGDVLCVVTRAWQELVDRVDPDNRGQRIPTEIKKVALTIVGTISGGFRRGVDHLPPVGSPAYFISGDVFDDLLNSALDSDSRMRLFPAGHRVGTGSGIARFDLDKFFGRHAAVLGTTGSGKSYTVAALAQAVLRSYARPRLVIFDIHDEYGPAFGGAFQARSTCIAWSDFRLPFWMLTFEEFAEVFCGGTLGSNQRVILADNIREARRLSALNVLGADDVTLSVDTPIPYEWNDLMARLDAHIAPLTKTEKEGAVKMIEKTKAKRRDPRYAFLFDEDPAQDALAVFFNRLFGLGETDVHATVLDLSGLPAEVRATAIGILCRLFFDYRYWDTDSEHLPVALVLEEAHSYIPAESDSRYTVALEAVERIAKEGRKYGLSLVVVSQRPANVSQTILSQCGTFVALRLTSDIDQSRVLRLLPDTLGDQGSLLASLRDGEAVVSGDGVTLPGRVLFAMPDPPPGSSNVRFHRAWTDGPPTNYSSAEVINRWLNQNRGR